MSEAKQAITVSAEGNSLNAKVTGAGEVIVPRREDVEQAIAGRVADVVSAITGDGVEDPTVKKCSRCAKMGRIALHNVSQFSTLKSGKLSSQCKVCRTEQSNEWCQRRADHRRQYHRDYRARRGGNPQPKVIKDLQKMQAEGATETIPEEWRGQKGLENLFIAFTNTNVKEALGDE